MKNLLDEEYINIGSKDLHEELWLNIQMEQIYKTYIKPYGGLWTSHQNKYFVSDWLEYKFEDNPYYTLEDTDATLIKFKNNARFLKIENSNDYDNLKQSGFVKELKKEIVLDNYYCKKTIKELIDYEKISMYYDLLYINPYAINILNNYSIKTMLALNPNCIDYYKTIELSSNGKKIIFEGEKKIIKSPSKEYYDLVNYINNMFYEIKSNNYDEYINELIKLKKHIIDNISEEKNIPYLNNTSINKYLLIQTIVKNIYREKYLEKQKKLKL